MTLSAYLKTNRIRQEDFAERIGVSQATVSRLVNGKQTCDIPLAVKIDRATAGAVPLTSWAEAEPQGDAA